MTLHYFDKNEITLYNTHDAISMEKVDTVYKSNALYCMTLGSALYILFEVRKQR